MRHKPKKLPAKFIQIGDIVSLAFNLYVVVYFGEYVTMNIAR